MEPKKEDVHCPWCRSTDRKPPQLLSRMSLAEKCYFSTSKQHFVKPCSRMLSNWPTPNISKQIPNKMTNSGSKPMGAPKMPNHWVCGANTLISSGAVKLRHTYLP
jgi:hypothetical protein